MTKKKYDPITDPERFRRNMRPLRARATGDVNYLQAFFDGEDNARRKVDTATSRRMSSIAKVRGRNISAAADDKQLRVRDSAEAIREKRPYDRERSSTRWLATKLSHQLGIPFGTVRRILGDLGIK